jgi:hypothetical protein
MMAYVGGEDCGPCRTWRSMEGERFLQSPEILHVTCREVDSPTQREALKDEHWPEDLRRYRDRLRAGAGVSLWLMISGDGHVEWAFGASQWHAAVLPRLKRLLH